MNAPFDPLSPEERALAERLRRVQPGVEPSSALDARILAAARAATPAPRVRGRATRWAWIPGGLVTAMGTAAAFVLAVGLVWQLRPTPEARVIRHAAEDDGGFVAADVVTTRKPALIAPPPPPPTKASADATPVAERAQPAPRAPALRAPRVAASPSAAPPQEAAAAPPPPPPPPQEFNDEWQARDAQSGIAAEAKVAGQRADTGANAATAAAAEPVPAPAAAAAPAAAPRAATELDRIEISGSRIRSVLPPLADDSRLEVAEWLQRIRERRESGDTAGATESLARFRHAHPRVHVPQDLRALER